MRRLLALLIAVGLLIVAAEAATARAAAQSVPACRSSALRAVFTGVSTAGPMELNIFGFTNRSAHTCTLAGYPAVTASNAAGRRLSLKVTKESTGAVRTVRLVAGGHAYLGVVSVVSGFQQGACVTAAGLTVVPLHNSAALTVRHTMIFCKGELSVAPFSATR